MRPFRPGDYAAFCWGKRLYNPGIIIEIKELPNKMRYAKLAQGNGSYLVYPVYQLVPVGPSQYTIRHMLYSLRAAFKGVLRAVNFISP